MEIVHLISSLAKGGAETALYNLIKHQSQNSDIQHIIVHLGLYMESDYYSEKIKEHGCEIIKTDIIHHPFKSIKTICQLMKKCDLFCGWMYNANLVSYYIAKLCKAKKLIWFARHADLSKKNNSRKTLIINRLCAKKSRSKLVKKIVYNGYMAKEIHEKCGYDKTKAYIVNNGCDLNFFNFNPDAKKKIFSELGLSEEKRILLSVTRNNKIKDIPLFISALAKVKKDCADVVGVMCGLGITEKNEEILAEIEQNGLVLGKDIILLGRRDDLPDLFSACDLYVLHSAGEAFPNVLIQAMACKSLCVATDVGDVSCILSQDAIVPPKNIDEMVKKINTMLNLTDEEKEKIRLYNVKDVCERFDIKNVVSTYEEIFLKSEG